MSRHMRVETVSGPVAPGDLGVTLPHEHVRCDFWSLHREMSYDGILDDELLLHEEIAAFQTSGGGTIVDATTIGIGRDPAALRRISAATGVRIVMGAGWYRERVYPPEVFTSTVAQLAARIELEFQVGADGTGVKPGIIGEIGTERFKITAAEERVFRAAARAQRSIGATITTHTTYFGDLALDQIAILRSEGVPPERILIGHVGEHRDLSSTLAIAKTGVFIEVDHVGANQIGQFAPEPQRVRNVVALVRAGHLDQMLLSMDICKRSQLHAYGGNGYDYLLVAFVPLLLEAGLSEADIHTMLVLNPSRALAF